MYYLIWKTGDKTKWEIQQNTRDGWESYQINESETPLIEVVPPDAAFNHSLYQVNGDGNGLVKNILTLKKRANDGLKDLYNLKSKDLLENPTPIEISEWDIKYRAALEIDGDNYDSTNHAFIDKEANGRDITRDALATKIINKRKRQEKIIGELNKWLEKHKRKINSQTTESGIDSKVAESKTDLSAVIDSI